MRKLVQLPDKIIIPIQIILLIFLLLLNGFFLQSCEDKCESVSTYTYLEPVYTTTQQVRDGFGITEPQPLKSSGKIYVFGDYLLINDPGEGIHIIDNTDCSNPNEISFIKIPGNFDMAVKDYVLYADSYIDLLAIDISNLPNITLLKRLEGAFPYYNYSWGIYYDPDQSNMIITTWEEKETVELNSDCRTPGFILYERGVLMKADAASGMSQKSNPQGIGGSMARFTLSQDRLYAVDNTTLRVFDVTTTADPAGINQVEIGWNIETIFPYKKNLFIGSRAGMYIYDTSNPDEPFLRSEFQHARSCDPVVVDDHYAYVTLRSGTECEGFNNQLDVIDISNLDNPILVKSYAMENPHGLSIDGNLLFITEGEAGMKLFDISDINNVDKNLLFQVKNIHGFDVIAFDQKGIMIGDDGLYMFNYANPANMQICGFIPVQGGI